MIKKLLPLFALLVFIAPAARAQVRGSYVLESSGLINSSQFSGVGLAKFNRGEFTASEVVSMPGHVCTLKFAGAFAEAADGTVNFGIVSVLDPEDLCLPNAFSIELFAVTPHRGDVIDFISTFVHNAVPSTTLMKGTLTRIR